MYRNIYKIYFFIEVIFVLLRAFFLRCTHTAVFLIPIFTRKLVCLLEQDQLVVSDIGVNLR